METVNSNNKRPFVENEDEEIDTNDLLNAEAIQECIANNNNMSRTTDFITFEEFKTLTRLNNVQKDISVDSKKYHFNLNNLSSVIENDEFNEIVEKHVLNNETKPIQYKDDLYEFFYYIIMDLYAKHVTDEELCLIENILTMILVHKANATTILKQFTKMLSLKKVDTKVNLRNNAIQLNKFIKRKRIDVSDEDTPQDASDFVIKDPNIRKLFEAFLDLSFILTNTCTISELGFKNIQNTNVLGKQQSTINALRLPFTQPILIPLSTLNVKNEYRFLKTTDFISDTIIDNIKSSVRFNNTEGNVVNLDFFPSISVCCMKQTNVLCLNKVSEDDDLLIKDWNIKYHIDNHQVYCFIDSVSLIYDDDANKITVKVFPISFSSDMKSIHKIDFGAIKAIEEMRSRS